MNTTSLYRILPFLFVLLVYSRKSNSQDNSMIRLSEFEDREIRLGDRSNSIAKAKKNMRIETSWKSVQLDFRLTSDHPKSAAKGIILNYVSSTDFGVIKFENGESVSSVVVGRLSNGFFRKFSSLALKSPLKVDKWYQLSIKPSDSKKEWRYWSISIINLENKEKIAEQGFENVMPMFGRGIVGHFGQPHIAVQNFLVNGSTVVPQQGDLELAPIFTNGVVLQRDKPAVIWGRSQPLNKVKVKILDKIYYTKADPNGNWFAKAAPMPATTRTTLEVACDKHKIIVADVAIGEVWIASGQSNMQMKIWQTDVSKIVHQNKNRDIRFFKQPFWPSEDSVFSSGGHWEKSAGPEMDDWSALAYSYACELSKALNVPIGIIGSYWGGTAAESLLPRSEMYNDVLTLPLVKGYDDAKISLKNKTLPSTDPWLIPGQYHAPGALFNGMIYPHIPFAIKGVIWYQGESNAKRAMQYKSLFPKLINSWRKAWNDKDLPFLFVQLAGYNGGQSGAEIKNAWPALREAQLMTSQNLHNTGMAVAIDLGHESNIHPVNKKELGIRLSHIALHDVYGQRGIVKSGPIHREVSFKDSYAIVGFDHCAGGLRVGSGIKLSGFEVAGKDGRFFPANAIIQHHGKHVYVTSERVLQPVAVRYAWTNNPANANLINSAGLPASPFRTDTLSLF